MNSLIIERYKGMGGYNKINKFNITNSFVSKENGNYCIEADIIMGRVTGKELKDRAEICFEKRGNKWIINMWRPIN